MSQRPILHKQAARMRKVLSRRPLPRYINLVEWLQDHGHAETAGQARKLLTDGRVKTQGGNVLGRRMAKVIEEDKEVVRYYPAPVVDATLRNEIVVVSA